MCGIACYTGKRKASEVVLKGLSVLEYRGYDSAGIALFDDKGELCIAKKAGYVSTLKKLAQNLEGHCAIGHTRWATHGPPTDENSHPHKRGDFCVVHNGIIENFLTLKKSLQKQGKKFVTQTDTEVIAALLEHCFDGDVFNTISIVAQKLRGSFALAILHKDSPDKIYVVKKKSPLVVGVGDGECFVSSDPMAFSCFCDDVVYLKDNEMGIVWQGGLSVFDFFQNKKTVKVQKTDVIHIEEGQKIKSHTKKEIFEIPSALRKTANDFFADSVITAKAIDIFSKNVKVIMTGCGTAYNACLVGKYIWESVLRVPVEAEIASEYRYKNPIAGKGCLFVAISQSGETADTIEATKLAKSKGADIIVITNVSHSTLTKYADLVLHTKAGCEVAVAATKSYVTQILLLLCMALLVCGDSKSAKQIKKQIEDLPTLATKALALEGKIESLAKAHCKKQAVFFVGRGLDYPLATEGALKLKEVSYVHSQGFAAGELKHGSLALVDKNVLVICLVTQKRVADKMMSALHEVVSRGGKAVVFTQIEKVAENLDDEQVIRLPCTSDLIMPVIAAIPCQLFAYYMSIERGLNPDRPRNLAKSVTVE